MRNKQDLMPTGICTNCSGTVYHGHKHECSDSDGSYVDLWTATAEDLNRLFDRGVISKKLFRTITEGHKTGIEPDWFPASRYIYPKRVSLETKYLSGRIEKSDNSRITPSNTS